MIPRGPCIKQDHRGPPRRPIILHLEFIKPLFFTNTTPGALGGNTKELKKEFFFPKIDFPYFPKLISPFLKKIALRGLPPLKLIWKQFLPPSFSKIYKRLSNISYLRIWHNSTLNSQLYICLNLIYLETT